MSQEPTTDPWLHLRLLGSCEILLPEGPVHLETVKTRALLIYLVLNPGPQSRHKLTGLLWGDLPEARARRNLRHALWDLRRNLSSPTQPLLLTDRENVRFNPRLSYWCDVPRFQAACAQLEAMPLLSMAELGSLRRAIELYRGDFLEGFFVADAPAFQEWALLEREHLRSLAIQAFQRLVRGYAARNQALAALDCAQRLLDLDPWREETHRWIMRLWAVLGQRDAAMEQYESCRRLLARTFGVEPSPETQRLLAQIRLGALSPPVSHLPGPATPFVDRTQELADLCALLGDPSCRLLTVTGLGGVGKSRLALEAAARQASSFLHGVCYVDLHALHEPQELPRALLRSLGLALAQGNDAQALLLAHLRERQTLLFLDGYEQRLAGAPFLAQILEAGPEIKLLVTSQERLHLQGEWVFHLDGLACPPTATGTDPTSFGAVQLFLQVARRACPGFQVGPEDWGHLVRICQLTGGHPLAIEMAAAWVRLLPLAEIEEQIACHLDFLASSLHDLPERHRSVQAIFDRSWDLLTAQEQDTLRQLSRHQGSFRLTEAAELTGVSLAVLSALVDKSLLQRTSAGRYRLPELLRQYIQERHNRPSVSQPCPG